VKNLVDTRFFTPVPVPRAQAPVIASEKPVPGFLLALPLWRAAWSERVKKMLDSIFFTQKVCVEAPQTSAGSHRRNRLRDFASGVSAQERFDMYERV